jgi:nitrous oxidase accessory protein NosD
MKNLAVFLTILFLLFPAAPARAGGDSPSTVVLTADMVHSAIDIESAFHQATAWGTRPGVVVLDGRLGAFEYDPEEPDKDINIFYSNLTLRGKNGAVLHGGGINLDGMPLANITIEGLEMHCPADCITSPDGVHRDVSVLRNRLYAENFGIGVGGTDGWTIRENTIYAGWSAVHLYHTAEITIMKNGLLGDIAVMLIGASSSQVTNNVIAGKWQGVVLGESAQANQVIANAITGVQASGIALDQSVKGNHVHGNHVFCAPGSACLTVEADAATWQENKISGNQPK